MHLQHLYKATVKWTGNTGKGTANYKDYARSHEILIENKAVILGSSDPTFRGDKTKHNPEELFLSSISSCHMLWFLHLCATAGVVVTDYIDNATGIMEETEDGGGRFINVTLHPIVKISQPSMVEKANELHQKANKLCFIANSCNFPIHHIPICESDNNASI